MIPSEDIQKKIKQLIKDENVPEVARKIGIAKETLARIAGGLPVHAGTIAQVKAWMEKR